MILALAGCRRGADMRPIQTTGPFASADTSVAWGGHWVISKAAAPRRVGDGASLIPAGVNAIIAFKDANGNGRLDLFVDPSMPCVTSWERCPLPPSKLVVHRLVMMPSAGAAAASHLPAGDVDNTYVMADIHDAKSGRAVLAATCRAGSNDCASDDIVVSDDMRGVPVLSLCDLRADEGVADIAVRAEGRTVTLPVHRPQAIALAVTSRRTHGLTILSLDVGADFSAALVTIGHPDAGKLVPIWSSEDEGVRAHREGNRLAVELDPARLTGCAGRACILVAKVQTMSVDSAGALPVLEVSESRVFTTLEEVDGS